jgi:coproporphyrinogen III oxidase-like Fe-S oxidoreductase
MSLQEYQAKFKEGFLQKYRKIIDKYLKKNFIEIKNSFIRLTPKAYFVSDEIFSEFM